MPSPEKLAEFVAWCQMHITGDEKGQAQIFLDRLFQSFGQSGCLDVGGSTEFRIRKSDEDGGGTAFADYVWKPVVLIEMKKRGENLQKHYRQAFDYWTRLVPNRPRYVVLCNFDEFRVYDFDTDLDMPKTPSRSLMFRRVGGRSPFLRLVRRNRHSTTTAKSSPGRPPTVSPTVSGSSSNAACRKRIIQKYIKLGEPVFKILITDLGQNTFATLVERRKVDASSKDRYVAVVDCRGQNPPGGFSLAGMR